MKTFEQHEIWLVVGSQHLYGPEALKEVRANAQQVVQSLQAASAIPVTIRFKDLVTTSEEILGVCREANTASPCLGLVFWMHTFSPAKMWIRGLSELQKPFLHLHTQFSSDLPWESIDMDFMNLHQSAHGGREFGHICARLGKKRKVVVGHWKEATVQEQIGDWCRAARGAAEMRTLKIARFGDNMRNVAVTEGDKVAAEECFGFSVNGYGIGDLCTCIDAATDQAVEDCIENYRGQYAGVDAILANTAQAKALRQEARIEAGMRVFLEEGGFGAFTDTFEDLHGLPQLPGLAVQSLMAQGYGFGAEGDWKTAALLRAMKVMATGLPGGASFMEDYTYDLQGRDATVLGAHMLEVCPTIANAKARLHVHPLGIGGKADPVRLIFTAASGPALNATLIDLGSRFRIIANSIETIEPPSTLPHLPVARALWKPDPDLATSAAAWIHAGGAHHAVYTQSLGPDILQDFAEMLDVELLLISKETRLADFKKELRWNEATY